MNVVSFHDPVIDGKNMEDTDLYEWQRRPGFSIFCSDPLLDGEVVNQFDFMRNLNGEVIDFADTNLRLATFTPTAITTLITKTTTAQGFITPIQNLVYFSDGAGADMQVWNSAEPISAVNPFSWGLAAPTTTPLIFNLGMWLPTTEYSSNEPVVDPNGDVEIAFIEISGPTSQTAAYTAESVIPIAGSYGAPWDADQHPVSGYHWWNTSTPEGTYSNYISFQGFGFSIPATAAILGIVVSITKCGIANNPASFNQDYSVKLTVDGAPSGTEHALVGNWSEGRNTGEIAENLKTYVYGSRTDTWGITPTPAMVNSPGFGIALSAESMGNPGSYPFVDGSPYPATIQIYYQLPSGPTGMGTSGLNEPVWSTVINSPTQDGTITWTNVGPIQIWYPVTNYSLPVVILDTNGNLQVSVTSTEPILEWDESSSYVVGAEVTFGGQYWVAVSPSSGVAPAAATTLNTVTSGSVAVQPYWINVPNPVTTGPVPPVWSTVIGGQTTDNDYTWTNIGPGALIESFGTSYVYGYRTIDGHLTTCSPSSINTGTILGPQSVGITAFSITGGVVTFKGVNNFVPGATFTVNGFGVGIYLNGQAFTVLAAGLSTTSFSANFVYTDVSSTADTGQTAPLIAAVTGVGTGSVLCNATTTLTSIAVLANIVTVYAVNDFVAGLYVTFSGLTTATWLNNVQLQIINVDPNGLWFEVYYQTPTNSTQTDDTGTVTFNAVEVYRVSDGGGIYLFAGAVTNPGPNMVWTYNDFTTDANLNILQIAALSHLNDPPPGAPGSTVLQSGTVTRYWQGRIWMVVGNFVYFDAGPDCTNGIPEQAWPPANRFQFAGPVLNLIPTPDGVGLLVYLADRVNVILGGPETISFYPTDAFSNFGISNPNAVFRDDQRIGQFTTQKQYVELAGAKEEIGEHIADYLTENFAAADTYATMHRDGLDVGVFLSNGVDQVLRFGSNISAWSVPAYPVGGAGALRSIETSVGTYSLMLASPAASTPTSIPPKEPTLGSNIGTGTAWMNPNNITLGNPATYATVALVASPSQILAASNYSMNVPAGAIIQGIKVAITGTGPAALNASENAGTGTDVPVAGGTAWNSPNNLATASQSTSVVVGTAAASDFLQGSNFGFAIPLNAKILGIEVTVTGQAAESSSVDTTQTIIPTVVVPWNSIAIGFDASGGVPVVAQQPNGGGNSGVQTSSASSFTFAIGISNPGDVLIVSATFAGTAITPGILDSFSNVWTKCLDFSANGIRQVIWSSISNGSTGSGTVTVSSGVNVTFAGAGFFEVTHLAGTFSVTTTGSGTSATPSAGLLATVTANTFALNAASSYPTSVNSMFTGVGWTQPGVELNANDGTHFLRLSWQYQVVAGSPTDGTLTIAPNEFLANTVPFSLTQSPSTQTFGTPTDLWGGTWTPAIINSAAFGFSIQALTTDIASNFVISYPMTVKVYYAPALTVTPLNPVVGAESDLFTLGATNTTVTFGGFSDLWGMPWISPTVVNANSFGFGIFAAGTPTADFSISEVLVTVYYGGTYILARDLNSWGDGGVYGVNNGTPSTCFVTVGSITLSQLGGEMFPLQNIVGYFDAVGTLDDGGPSEPDIWILPNEVNDTKGIGFVFLPETIEEPPIGQNNPSSSLLALRWNVNMMNSKLASQFIHHLQVKIQFEAENAPNTIKAIAFKEDQSK